MNEEPQKNSKPEDNSQMKIPVTRQDFSAPAKKAEKAQISSLKKFFFGFFSVFILFGCVEAVLRVRERVRFGSWSTHRLLRKGEKELYVTHPYLGRIPKPGLTMNFNGRDISINSLGFRGPEINPQKEIGVFRIACLGASTTFCADALKDEGTWPSRLQHYLNKKIESGEIEGIKKVEVINAGVPGYTTIESLINYELRVGALKPDLVFVYHGYNDLAAYGGENFSADYSHWRNTQAHKPGRDRELENYFVRHSVLLIKMKQFFAKLGERTPEETVKRKKESRAPDEGVKAFEEHLLRIGRAVKADGADVVLSTFASLYADVGPEPDEECMKRLKEAQRYFVNLDIGGVTSGLARNNDALQMLALSQSWPLFDGRGALGKDSSLFTDEIHMNEKGMEKFAKAFGDFLIRENVLRFPKE